MNLLVARYFGIGNEILFNLQVIGAASWHGNSPALLFMNVENWTSLRAYYPILSSNFSYINPITLILLNKDIQKMMRHMIFGSKKPIPVTPQSLKVASTSIQMT
uniref:G_PROTEIN_RECEP_F1_2 domain-containing protein n=1 Tax=Caenorhabditis tropicalis TaxID=1561998 RepID=A0A1I7TH27_9PELO